MNIPEDCKHKDKFEKDCCEIIWSGTIVEHDGCVTNSGCDLVTYDDERIFFIEIKGGNISSSDADKIIDQIEKCETWYGNFISHRKKSRLFIRCVNSKRRRLDPYARIKLKNARIRMYDCKRLLDLENL
ncbi:hypothetical protein DRP05_09400 [Archaeoglobales archaeon]|nr:MAG: hypothetical protein DRP05_09400 [Archaeoglobales archaeon]